MEENKAINKNTNGKNLPAPEPHFGRAEESKILNRYDFAQCRLLTGWERYTLDSGYRYATEAAFHAGYARFTKARQNILLTEEEFLAEADAEGSELAKRTYAALKSLADDGVLDNDDVYQYARYQYCIRSPQAVIAYYSEHLGKWLANSCDTEISEDAAALRICRKFGFEASRIEIMGTPYYEGALSCFIRFDCKGICWLAKDGDIFRLNKD